MIKMNKNNEEDTVMGVLNELLIAFWFLLGSFFFLSHRLETLGGWLFVLGSIQMAAKPFIKVTRLMVKKRAHKRVAIEEEIHTSHL